MTDQEARNVAWFIRHTIAEAAEEFPSDPDKWVTVRMIALADDIERDPTFSLEHLAWMRDRYGEVPA